jgi:cytoskeleton-associated protein 5
MGQMIEALGLNMFAPATTLKEIAKQIGDRDTSVRNAALNTITIAYQIAGDQVFKYIGKVFLSAFFNFCFIELTFNLNK